MMIHLLSLLERNNNVGKIAPINKTNRSFIEYKSKPSKKRTNAITLLRDLYSIIEVSPSQSPHKLKKNNKKSLHDIDAHITNDIDDLMTHFMKCEQSESNSANKQMNNRNQTSSLIENSPNATKIKIINESVSAQPIRENEISNNQVEIDMFKFSQPISQLIQDKNRQYEGLSKLIENDSGAGSVAFFEAVKMFKFKIQGNLKRNYEQISHQAVNKDNEQTYRKTKEMVEMEKINFMSSKSKIETIIKSIVKEYDEEREQEFEKMKPKLLQDFNEAQVNNTKLTKINNIFKTLVKQTFLE